MNKKYYLIILASLVFLTTVSWAKATFVPQAKLEKILIRIADFVPPPSAQFLFDDYYFLPTNFKFEWNEVSDFGESSGSVSYQLKFDNSIYSTTNNYQYLDLSAFEEGEHKLWVRACDSVNNCSSWSQERKIVVDKSIPSLKILDRKTSGDGIYGYIKLKLIDNYSLERLDVLPAANNGVISFFDDGYFYEEWKNSFQEDFWIVMQLSNSYSTTNIKAWDKAGNMREEQIIW